jgi:ketosteroid isomerase-like protein
MTIEDRGRRFNCGPPERDLRYSARSAAPPKEETMRGFVVTLGLCALFSTLVSTPALAAAPDKDVLAALEAWKQAMIKKDKAAFEKLYHPDLSFAHSSGVIETKEQAIEHVVGGAASFDAIDLAETKVRVHGNTALVTGKMDYHQREKDKVNLVKLVVLTVWMKGGKQGWQMIARQAARLNPPPATPPAPPAPPTPPAAPPAH